jgi:hypothetical protein
MANAKFKFDNRDVVVVTGAEDVMDAVSAAETLLNQVSDEDETTDYGLGHNADLSEPFEDGRFEFPVVISNK